MGDNPLFMHLCASTGCWNTVAFIVAKKGIFNESMKSENSERRQWLRAWLWGQRTPGWNPRPVMNDLEPEEGASLPRPVFSCEAATWTSGGHSCQLLGVAIAAVMAILPPPLPNFSSPCLSPSYFLAPTSPHQKEEAGLGSYYRPACARTGRRSGPGATQGQARRLASSATGWSLHPAPALSQNDRWPPKGKVTVSRAIVCLAEAGGVGFLGALLRPLSGIWGPGPRQQPDFIWLLRMEVLGHK